MNEFLKNRQIESETYAIITYFKLLKQAELVNEMEIKGDNYQEDAFTLIGGVETFNRLLIYYQEGHVDVFEQSTGKLFTKLEENIEFIKTTAFSKNLYALKAIADFELIKKFYNDTYSVNGNPDTPAIYGLTTLPLPKNVLEQILNFKSKTKTIGER